MTSDKPCHLTVVVCGAGPASDVGRLVQLARSAMWTVNVIATPAALYFLDVPELEGLSGAAVKSQPRDPAAVRDRTLGLPDVVVVAPATFNTINKLAQGIADNYAMTVLAEAIGSGVPVILVPFVNSALASRLAYQASLKTLRLEGAEVVEGEGAGWVPHEPGTGETKQLEFPWERVFGLVWRHESPGGGRA